MSALHKPAFNTIVNILFVLLCSTTLLLIIFGSARAAVAQGCSDVLIVFARGSSDNPLGQYLDLPFESIFQEKEKVGGAFFREMKTELDNNYPNVTYKAVSIHNFPNLYNQNGYRAVSMFGFPTLNNVLDAEFGWWPWGEYRGSVSDGIEETVGYVKDQVVQCPNQQIVLGGYSQGAHVIGDALFRFAPQEREKIGAVALFGDPKYIGSDVSLRGPVLNWFDSLAHGKPAAEPWKRGSATLKDRGLADARIPYVPSDMEYKVMSWCFVDDFVCTGYSGIGKTLRRHIEQTDPVSSPDDAGVGHLRYPSFGVKEAAQEAVVKLSLALRAANRARGGVDPELGVEQSISTATYEPITAMITVNTSAGADGVLGTLRMFTGQVVPQVARFFPSATIGIADYNENGTMEDRWPRVDIRKNQVETSIN